MKKKLLYLLLLISTSMNGFSQCWQQTWSDEFDGTALDQTKWNYILGDGCPSLCGWGNNELEYYTNSTNNVSVSGGQLAITARYQSNYNGTGKNYTSGKIVTSGKFSQKYGRYEAKIKAPSAAAVWPAFWMLADNNNWPSTGEIDIMECKNANPTTWYGTIHYANSSGSHLSTGTTWNSPVALSNDFHIYAMEWDTQEIRWYIDGTLRFTATKTQVQSSGGVWPFDNQNFYIILNVAVGGNFTGYTGNKVRNIPSTDYPASMLVDYVRVYQATTCAPTSYVNITSPSNNASFDFGTDIEVTADASFVNGTVAKVEFFDNNTKIGEDTTSPYSAVFTRGTLGGHDLTAVATDSLGSTLTSTPVTITINPIQTPFTGSAYDIPGRIEAENYDMGGQDLAYSDATAGNLGNVYRSDDVDIQLTTDVDGSYEIYNTSSTEWLEYTVNVTTPGTYKIDLRFAAPAKKYGLKVELDGVLMGAISNTKPTGTTGYQTVSISSPSLTAGQKVLRISFTGSNECKLNHVSFTNTGAKMASLLSVDNNNDSQQLEVYPNPANSNANIKLNVTDISEAQVSVVNAMGKEVYKCVLSSDLQTTINLSGMESGIYFVKVTSGEKTYIEKLVKE